MRVSTRTAPAWAGLPAAQQPHWLAHPARSRVLDTLAGLEPLVTPAELDTLRGALAEVAAGRARVLQAGDCAESFHGCTPGATAARLEVLDRLADALAERTGAPVVRVGRIAGQFAKPRSSPTELCGGVTLPAFRGHMINSEVPTAAARAHDPRRMVWAYQASARTGAWVASARVGRAGPWTSHEALVLDYEAGLVRTDPASGKPFLGSTHLPWVGERTRQPENAHVRLLGAVTNPVGCKVGPTVAPPDLVRLCALLDPERLPGRLVLIARMGAGSIERVLPGLVAAVAGGGHRPVWLCDPMHGNTVTAASGRKTRYVATIIAEAAGFARVMERTGQFAGGLHLETAPGVTECVGGAVPDERRSRLTTRHCAIRG
ncbi:3-deoxy-7-phosphoheptulonate synthase [Actinophytocola xanthii]|uniref:3-deoxy-7-phosphoheptulonate synthase n=1 Tax=Actinophytocola xanthii TaxID=1912961 RepID=UPI000A5F3877|nr:3-deoxy-7-phosphoheptulonate synthase [Actinophytocola xanthii]